MKDRIPPYDTEAEQSLLGAMLLSKEAIIQVEGILRPEYFYLPGHSAIYEAITTIFSSNQVPDLITVSDYLKKKGQLEEVGGRSYLAEILDTSPSTHAAQNYAEIIAQKAVARQLMEFGCEISDTAMDEECEIPLLLERAQNGILNLSNQTIRKRVRPINEVLSSVYDRMQEAAQGEGLNGISTGFADLDKCLTGLKNSDLIIVAARPSMGKTTFALNIALNAAKKGVGVLFFSIETPSEHLGTRLLSMDSKIDSRKMMSSEMSDRENVKVMHAMGRVGELPLFFEDTGALSTLELRTITRQMQREESIGMIVIDYLGLMRNSAKRFENRYQEVSQIVREIKAFAKDIEIPVILLSQLSRDNEKRMEKRPALSDLRESGEIEQTADVVLFLHRDDYYQQHSEVSDGRDLSVSQTEVIISKHRNGPIGTVKLMYKLDTSTFYSTVSEKVGVV